MARNKYPEETVQKILDTALQLFTEKGYDQTTIQDIVDHLGGLSRGAIYHHFKSKADILSALSDQMFYEDNPFEAVKADASLNGLEKMQTILKQSFQPTARRTVSEASVSLMKDPRFLAELVDSNNRILTPAIRELIGIGMADGSIRAVHPDALAELATLLTNFWFVPTIFPTTPELLMEKVLLTKLALDAAGLPVFDQELIDLCQHQVDLWASLQPND